MRSRVPGLLISDLRGKLQQSCAEVLQAERNRRDEQNIL